jgi:hypothetical protein
MLSDYYMQRNLSVRNEDAHTLDYLFTYNKLFQYVYVHTNINNREKGQLLTSIKRSVYSAEIATV